jgi:hypothetical protein
MEIWLVSQYALSRSYVPRLTLMLRRVCFFAISKRYAIPSRSSRSTYYC